MARRTRAASALRPARLFAREGAQVVVAGRRLEPLDRLAQEIGGCAVACDITVDEDVEALVDRASTQHGRLDVAMNCAGGAEFNEIADLDFDRVRRVVEVQFIGALRFLKAAAGAMEHGGSIITTSSLSAQLAPWGWAAYAGTKAGVDQVVKIAATEYGPRGVRVNAIAPGLVRTAMTEAVFEEAPGVLKAMLKEQRIPRFATAADIANAALWLASDEAFMTGQVLQLSGGGDLGKYPLPDERAG